MPTYEYECQKCGHIFEIFQGINDKPRSRCPKCRGKVQRIIGSNVGIVFKGSGFYVTDSRKKSSEDKPGVKKEKSDQKSDTPQKSKPESKSQKNKKSKSQD